MKRYWMIAAGMLLASAIYAQEEKTREHEGTTQEQTQEQEQKTTELEELVVKGENAWIENGKAVFIPQKSAKNLARDMASLIGRMNTGILTVDQGEIKTSGGQGVSLFINGVPVDDMDAATFWAKNALRVEYMPASDDPRFRGATNIVNFVMKEYVAGGLTRLNANQIIPNDGRYMASSKLVFGRMTYNAVFKGGYSRDHFSGSDRNEEYDDIWYDGNHYDIVSRHEESSQTNRQNDIYAGINARYTDKKHFNADHSVALQWNENPSSLVKGIADYSPRIIDGNEILSISTSRSLSPKVTGNYSYYTNKRWAFFGDWSLAHSHNNNFSAYEEGLSNPIETSVRENVYNIFGNLAAQFKVTEKMFMRFSASEKYDIYNMAYRGNTTSDQKQKNSTTDIKLEWWYTPIPNLNIFLMPQLTIFDYDVDSRYHNTDCMPGLTADIGYRLNRKSNLNLRLFYHQQSPMASTRNDLILRQTELKWLEGNPSLKPQDYYWLTLTYFVMPVSWLNTSVALQSIHKTNQSLILYRGGGKEYDGVVGQYLNSAIENRLGAIWDFTLNFIDGRLRIHNQLEYSYQHVSRYGSLHWLRVRPSITWDFGNCSLTAQYGSPQKNILPGGTGTGKGPHYYGLNFSYGNGNLIVDVELNEIFDKRLYHTTFFESGPYSYTSRSWKKGRSVAVSLTYTFDYGKKVDPSINISTQEIRSTSVLGAD